MLGIILKIQLSKHVFTIYYVPGTIMLGFQNSKMSMTMAPPSKSSNLEETKIIM